MPCLRENPCFESHQELQLMTEATSFSDRRPVMHCNRCGENLPFEDAVRNDERMKTAARIAAVLAYVDKLPCSNCEHVHNNGRCMNLVVGGVCGCTWGPNDITKDIRDLLKEMASPRVLAYVVRDPNTGAETGYPPEAVRIVHEDRSVFTVHHGSVIETWETTP